MHNEIPPLEVITAVSDPDFENYLAQLLFSQGWRIIYRALDAAHLPSILESRRGQRTVLVFTSSLPGFSPQLLALQSEYGFTAISLDSIPAGEKNSHNIMAILRSHIHIPSQPVEYQQQRTPIEKIVKQAPVITVSGSSGSPGRTLMARAISEELSITRHVTLIDADTRNRSASRLLRQEKSSFEVATLDPRNRPNNLPQVGERNISVVDLGALPYLGEIAHDRRWEGVLMHSALQATTHLLYICAATPQSVGELATFIDEFPLILQATPMTFLCITGASTRAARESLAQFDTLLEGNRSAVLPHRLLVDSGFSVPLISTPTRSKKEIARIALSLL